MLMVSSARVAGIVVPRFFGAFQSVRLLLDFVMSSFMSKGAFGVIWVCEFVVELASVTPSSSLEALLGIAFFGEERSDTCEQLGVA